MTLDEFVRHGIGRMTQKGVGVNAHVKEPGFTTLYLRVTRRYMGGVSYEPVLDIADVTVREDWRGCGIFTDLLDRIRETYPTLHLYIENVLNGRLQKHLERYGFAVVAPRLDPPCYFLPARPL